jgi:hypothetical protein
MINGDIVNPFKLFLISIEKSIQNPLKSFEFFTKKWIQKSTYNR